MGPLQRKLLRDFWRTRGQALAIITVVGCGVGVMVMSFGVLVSLTDTRDAYYERSRFADVFSRLERAPESLRNSLARISGVHTADIRIVKDVTIDVPKFARPVTGRLISLPSRENEGLNRVTLRWGRVPNAGALNEAIVSENFADAHRLQPGATLTANLNGRRRTLRIVGVGLSPEFVYTMGGAQVVPDDKSFGVLWMNRDVLESAFDMHGAFNDVSLRLNHAASAADVVAALDRILAPYGGLGAFERSDQTSHAFLTAELDQLHTMGWIIPPVFLAVAAFLLYVVIARTIDTEREQIGLLKAFGYSNWDVGRHYAQFVGIIAALGILCGFAAGIWLGRGVTELYRDFYRFPFLYYRLDLGVFAIAAALTFLAAALGTWLAVMKAVRLSPAVAMQPPAPALFRRSLTESLGLARLLSPSARIIVRDIERRPLRAMMTVGGIAASVGLLVSSLYVFDSIEAIIDVYYFRSQRQDLTVTYIAERDDRALNAIRRLPGVLRAEPFRAVPIRMQAQHRYQRTGIFALSRDGSLYQLLDEELSRIALPPKGILLSDMLAKQLGVRVGDQVDIEVLTGRRKKTRSVVAAIAREFVGLSAYMEMTELNRLLDEGSTASGAYLLTDLGKIDQLFAALKKTPGVASVVTKRAAVDTFRSTFSKSMSTVLLFYVGFGAMITFGVVYNSARISLSERARELATLRVLGFSKGQTAAILLGEFALLTFVALPFGWMMGYGLASFMTARFETELFRVPLVVTTATYAAAALCAIAAAIVSGFLVARRIRALDLVAVLKTRD